MPDHRLFRLFCITLLAAAGTAAGTWTSHGPNFKVIKAVEFSPQDTSVVYAGAFGSGVFKSTDAGTTWTNVSAGLINAYVRSLKALSNTVVFCGTNDGVFKTTDGGLSWSQSLLTAFSVRSLAYDGGSGNLYAASFGTGLYKSTNQGASWTQILVLDPVVHDTLFHLWSVALFGRDSLYVGGSLPDVHTGGALFRSLDGGASWIQVQRSLHIGSSVHSIAISPNSPSLSLIIGTAAKGVYKSTNAGVNWTDINGATTPNPLPDNQVNAVAFSPGFRFAGTDSLGGFYARALNDTTVGWIPGTGLPGRSAVVSSIALNRSHQSSLYLGTEGNGVYRSSNSGASWGASNGGMLGVAARVIERNSNGQLVLGADFGDGIWTSSDQGTTWIAASSLPTSDAITGIVSTTNPSVLYAAAYGTGVFKSTDGGSTWAVTDTTTINHFARTLSINPSNSNILWCGTGNGVYTTTNGGASWQAANNGIPQGTSVRSMTVDPGNPNNLYIGTDSLYMFRSTDGGGNWTHITSAAGFLPQDIFIRSITIDYASASTLYAGADSGRIYRSTDGASSWVLLTTLPATHTVRSILIHPTIHNVIFAATFGDGIFSSIDGGTHWQTMNDGLQDSSIYVLESDHAAPLNLYAGSSDHGVYHMTYQFTDRPPVLQPIGNKSVIAGQQLHFAVTATDSDFTVPSLSASGLPSGASFTDSLNGHGSFDWTPTLGQVGNFIVKISASDGTLSDSELVHIQVLDPAGSSLDTIPIEAGWNLLSVPVTHNDYHKALIFPLATSSAFAYQGSYTVQDPLQRGLGYWLKFPFTQDITDGGGTVSQETLSVSANWNMIGSISRDVPVTSLVEVPPLVRLSGLFGYTNSGGYSVSDSVLAGRGYWVKVNQAGSFVLTSSPATVPKTAARIRPPDAFGSMTFTDEEGRTRSLSIFNGPPSAGEQSPYELPPVPPPDGFDARFVRTQSSALFIDPSGTGSVSHPIELSPGRTLTVRWSFPQEGPAFELAFTGGPVYRLLGTGSAAVPAGTTAAELRSAGAALPEERVFLDQNFPNPFNPATTIRYFVPFAASVSVVIFNVAGQEVAAPVKEEHAGAGWHSVLWNAGNLSSGVYYCRLTAAGPGNPARISRQGRTLVLLR